MRLNKLFARSMVLIAAVGLVATLGIGSQCYGAGEDTSTNNTPIADVIVVVMPGAINGMDGISFTYNKPTDERVAKSDLENMVKLSGLPAGKARTSNVEGVTTGEIVTRGLVKWERGVLTIEPFIVALKRFDKVELHYLISGNFRDRSIKDYNDKNVDIAYRLDGNDRVYTIDIKDHNFERLNLPEVVLPEPAKTPSAAPTRTSSSGNGWIWYSLITAAVAGGVVYYMMNRAGKK